MLGPKAEIAMSPHLGPKRPRKVATLSRGVAVVAKKPSTTDHISCILPSSSFSEPSGGSSNSVDASLLTVSQGTLNGTRKFTER